MLILGKVRVCGFVTGNAKAVANAAFPRRATCPEEDLDSAAPHGVSNHPLLPGHRARTHTDFEHANHFTTTEDKAVVSATSPKRFLPPLIIYRASVAFLSQFFHCVGYRSACLSQTRSTSLSVLWRSIEAHASEPAPPLLSTMTRLSPIGGYKS
jgi:hypothetical protein